MRFGLLWVFFVTAAPLWARFELSRSSMDRLAHEVLAAPVGTTFHDRRVGLYRASSIARFPYGMRSFVESSGGGFAYSPRGRPPDVPGDYGVQYDHVAGPWYAWADLGGD